MRIGQNPLRGKLATANNPHAVVCAIVHLPNLVGYHEHRLEVVKLCLVSMARYCGDAAVLVWDNGSCAELREWLQKVYKPDYLMLSPNIGKQSARANIMHMFPPKTIIGISDDDVFFYPDWFKACSDLLSNFPKVGLVSGYPVRTQFRWGCSKTIQWGAKNGKLSTGELIPNEWDRDFCASIGRDYRDHLDMTAQDKDYMVEFDGRRAYLTGHHCQFIGYNHILAQFCDWNGWAMGDEKVFDISIDQAGFLRLTTVQRYCRHIGNVIDDSVKKDAEILGLIEEVE